MEINHFIRNAESDQMEELAGRSRLKYDMVTVGIFEGKIDLLRAPGIMPQRVSMLQARVTELQAEANRHNEKEAA